MASRFVAASPAAALEMPAEAEAGAPSALAPIVELGAAIALAALATGEGTT